MSRTAGVAIALTAMSLTAQAPLDPRIEIVNLSGIAISELLVKTEGSGTWRRLTLGIPIGPGEQRSVRITTEINCLFDVRAVYEDRRTEERAKVNVCTQDGAIFDAPQPRTGDSR
jgi:hypothetical protein